ncbi:hypothetical protein CRUP_026952 [Coryphaenoides rupestris]|nr:hypothetical protein CRUP_026952 [Coryphaenoides rupestris]
MFIEDTDWNDEQASQALSKPLLNKAVEKSNGKIKFKVKGVGKKSLLRTLQTLGSAAAPDQKGDGVQKEDSGDSEPEESSAPARPKRKKKRNRGRKKTNEGETETAGLDDNKKKANSGPKEIKKKDGKKGSLKPKKTDSGNETSKATLEKKEESELSRKQWKNKMKNRRKCKNKYREKDLEVRKADTAAESNMGEQRKVDTLSINSDSKGTKMVSQSKAKQQKNPKPQKRKRTEPAESAPSETDDVQTLKPTNKRPKKDTKVTEKQRVKTKAVGSKKPYEPPTEVVEVVEVKEEEDNSMASSKRQKFQKLHKETLKRKSLLKMLQSQPDKAQLPTGNQDPEEEEEEEVVEVVQEVQEEGGGTAAAPEDRSASLRCRMEQRLEAARFRYINEVLYTSSSGEAKRMFSQDPQAFGVYHKGFTAQVQRWPANPVDAIIAYIQNKPASQVVADFGCGDCKIARSVKNKVHSFDLAPVCSQVTVCDMAHVPLKDATVHIAVFCLSLMGTNLIDFLAEANRVLVMGGVLKIAEVASRFDDLRGFLSTLSNLGFKMMLKDTKNSHFYSFEFLKTKDVSENMKSSRLELKPCVYKKR